MKDQEQVKENIVKKNGKNWVGNKVKNWPPIKTPEEYWEGERTKVKEEYLSLFDRTESRTLKRLLVDFSVLSDTRFTMSLGDFEDLTEKEFNIIQTITSEISIESCDPSKLVYSIYRKEELEKYLIRFKPTLQTLKDLYNQSDWTIDKYTFKMSKSENTLHLDSE